MLISNEKAVGIQIPRMFKSSAGFSGSGMKIMIIAKRKTASEYKVVNFRILAEALICIKSKVK
jgi:hypothetical protein